MEPCHLHNRNIPCRTTVIGLNNTVIFPKRCTDDPEVRFDALKVFSDYVTQFMCEEKIY